MSKAIDFLIKYNNAYESIDKEEFINSLNIDIDNSLNKKGNLAMINTYLKTNIDIKNNERVLVLDLGGTNLRISYGYYLNNEPIMETLVETKMLGIDKELSKEEFYNSLYELIKDYVDSVERIGICFSYQASINKNYEGTLISWSKEVKAKEVIGSNINNELDDIIYRNTSKHKKIVLINDTCACLLGNINKEDTYSSYIGLIFGTGFNICYVDNINEEPILINSECADFKDIYFGKFDIENINKTSEKDKGNLEKITSGRYLADLINISLDYAYKENIINNYYHFDELKDISLFINKTDDNDTKEIIDNLIKRSALLIALSTYVFINKSYKLNDNKILVAIEGSTFYKLPNFKEYYLDELAKLTSNYCFKDGRNSNLKGTLYASFIK